MKEEYKAKKLKQLEDNGFLWGIGAEKGDRLQAFLSQTIEELWALPEKKEEFIAVKDNDCHRYQIPRNKKEDWYKWLEIPEDDERSWDVPDYAERIDGEDVEDNRGWNTCIAEAERLRDLSIKGKG